MVRVGAAKLGGSDVMSNETVIVAADDAFTAVLSASRPHALAGLRQPRQRHIQCLHLLYAEPRLLWPRRSVIRRKLAGLHQAIDRRPRAPKKSGSASQRHVFRHQRMIRDETGKIQRAAANKTCAIPPGPEGPGFSRRISVIGYNAFLIRATGAPVRSFPELPYPA